MGVGWGKGRGMRLRKVHEEECIVIAIERLHKEGSICILVRLSEIACSTSITAFILLTVMPGSDNGGYCQSESHSQ
jgi:hypothetical protein